MSIDKKINKKLDDLGTLITGQLEGYLLSKYPNLSSSNFIKNIYFEVDQPIPDINELVIKMPNYAIYIDRGRAPGKPMPPKKPIVDWMKRNGIEEEAQYAIRKHIAKNGIKPRPFLAHLAQMTEQVDDALFDLVEDELLKELDEIFKKITTI